MSDAKKIRELLRIMNHQLCLDGLWPRVRTPAEAYLIAALQHLHAVIEDDVVFAKYVKGKYWDLDVEVEQL